MQADFSSRSGTHLSTTIDRPLRDQGRPLILAWMCGAMTGMTALDVARLQAESSLRGRLETLTLFTEELEVETGPSLPTSAGSAHPVHWLAQ